MWCRTILAALAVLPVWGQTPASADARADSHACDLSIMSKDWEQALQRCDRAIQSGQLAESDLAHALASRCWAQVKLGRFDDALMDCNEAIRLDPDFVGAYSNRASAHRVEPRHEPTAGSG